MKMRIQVIIEDEAGLTTTAEIAAIERRLSTDLIGISLEEAKAMTGSVQRVMVETQAREAIDRGSRCPECQLRLRRNGLHRIRYRTPFGRLDLDRPVCKIRVKTCHSAWRPEQAGWKHRYLSLPCFVKY